MKSINKFLKEMDNEIRRLERLRKNIYSTNLVKRGSEGGTMYFRVPGQLRKNLKPAKCCAIKVDKGNKLLFLFEVKKKNSKR